MSCKCKCKFDGEKYNSNQNWIMINVDASVNNIYVKKIIFRILLYVVAKMVNIWPVYLMIQWFRVMKLLQKKQKYFQWILIKKTVKQKFLYFTCFLLITIALLIVFSIYCYLIKYGDKTKMFIPISRR